MRFENSLLEPHTNTAEIKMLGYRYNYVCVSKNTGRSDEYMYDIALLFGKLPLSALAMGRRDSLY